MRESNLQDGVYTMSSARQTDVPLHAATFLAQAGEKAGSKRHTHLVGDALQLAEQIAESASNIDDGVAGARRTFTNGKEVTSFERNTLAGPTSRQVRIYDAMGRSMGLPLTVGPSVDFIRDKDLGRDVVAMLAAIYGQHGASTPFDVNSFYDLFGLDHPDGVATHSTFSDLACATVPKRFRSLPRDAKLRKSFYAAMEGAIAAALIDRGAQYLSYQGADIVNEKPRMTSIDMMRFMTLVVVRLAMSNPDLCDKIRSPDGFVVDPELNGLGFGVSDQGRLMDSVNDPHTMERGEPPASHIGANATQEHSIMTKLPFVFMEDGKYVPVAADEFDRMAADETGGIFTSHWLRNFPAVSAFFNADPARIVEVERRITAKSSSFRPGDVGNWLDTVRVAKPDSRGIPKVGLVVPGRLAPAAGVIVNMIAKHVVDLAYPKVTPELHGSTT